MARKSNTIKETPESLLRKEYPSTEEWVKAWLKLYFHEDPDYQTVFYGNSSFIDIGDMLRNADSMYLTRCAIYDTDIWSQITDTGEYRRITFHVCVRSADPLDGKDVENAKAECLRAVNEFRKFYLSARKLHNRNVLTLEEAAPAESGAPYLDGWHTIQVSLRYFNKFCEVPNWKEYGL